MCPPLPRLSAEATFWSRDLPGWSPVLSQAIGILYPHRVPELFCLDRRPSGEEG